MLKCPVARAGGLARLSADVYARSTQRSRKSRLATLVKLAADAQHDLVPVTVESIWLLAGALKAGNYRSGAGYLGFWRGPTGRRGSSGRPTWRPRAPTQCEALSADWGPPSVRG